MSTNVDAKPDLKPEPLTKRDITKSWLLWYFFAEISNSFERLQTLAFCASMIPILKKLYKTKESLSAALKRHLVFFNTQGTWGTIIHGITIAMEEEKARGADIPDEAITGIKTGLMGPFAGIGDTIDWATLRPIVVSLFLPFAMQGSVFGVVAPLVVFTAITMAEGYFFWHMGYRLGRESVMAILEGGWIQQLITGAGVLGMFMMGALSGQFVKVSTPIKFAVGGKTYALQQILNSIVPGLLPLVVVFAVYLFLLKKGAQYKKVLFAMLAVSLIAAVLGIL
ncbi:MAG: PTS system mannose/fructose/sorbose family transporter subunit IID [Candidatus Fermentithermobacillus carboniphilus]|uniref:PTS system mannose/fructose/sorbose family transporter subunit IID n=1 Tax=Candidatus Fermentithermobacillus carboniphilus TaxID=3085328 RepID=A0AAT9LAT8_9FIRM|nr:MAG: PTS system mannose/fructose/sorbose family transporter subunit IID [Candidatus Fermentithermobacillus carboniphilus]